MSLKSLIALAFIAAIIALILLSYGSSQEADKEIIRLAPSMGEDGLLDMAPAEIFRMTVRNALPEIKILSGLLFLVLIVAFLGARMDIGSDAAKDILDKAFASMVIRRAEKLEAAAKDRRIRSELKAGDKESLRRTLAELERHFDKGRRNP